MKKTTVLLLIRHGETKWNREYRAQGSKDSPLTQKGISQAEETRQKLENIKIDAVYSSPLGRAYDTAGIITSGRNLEIIKYSSIQEINLGPWEGKTVDELKDLNPEQFENFRTRQQQFSLEGAETFLDVQERVVSGVKTILNNNEGKTVLAVSHGIAIKTAEIYFKKMKLSDLQNTKVLGNGNFLIFTKKDNIITVSDDISILS